MFLDISRLELIFSTHFPRPEFRPYTNTGYKVYTSIVETRTERPLGQQEIPKLLQVFSFYTFFSCFVFPRKKYPFFIMHSFKPEVNSFRDHTRFYHTTETGMSFGMFR